MDPTLIPRLAREAGITKLEDGGFVSGEMFLTWEDFTRFAAMVAEEAAKVCDAHSRMWLGDAKAAKACAHAIRERFKP